MSPPRTAEDRLRRLLALVPWVASQDGPSLDEVCARFGYREQELVDDLQLLVFCGVHPFTPDTLIEASVERRRVWIRFADWFDRPLRLTPMEGLSLVAAGSALLAVPGQDPEGPLARALAKLAAVLGVDPDEAVDVELGEASADVLTTLQRAAAEHHHVELDYYSYGRDEWARRIIEPHLVFNTAGQWYTTAFCQKAQADRIFRVDRMRDAVMLDTTFTPSPGAPSVAIYSPRPDDPLVVLDLPATAAWVAEQYPNEGTERLEGGGVRVRLRISERPWLERLLLRIGPDARVVKGDARVAGEAAGRVLAVYDGTVVSP